MKKIIAIVGMPGAGKSAAADFFRKKNVSVLRFGDLTEEVIREKNMPLTPENEKTVREQLRRDSGMEIYAVKIKPKIEEKIEGNQVIVLDGLYSWEEYIYLLEFFPQLKLLHIYASPEKRYERLAERAIRPLMKDEARERDFAEIENLHKGGPIAIADYLVENMDDDMDKLNDRLEKFLEKTAKKI